MSVMDSSECLVASVIPVPFPTPNRGSERGLGRPRGELGGLVLLLAALGGGADATIGVSVRSRVALRVDVAIVAVRVTSTVCFTADSLNG